MKIEYETEEEFLAHYKPSDYPRPSVTTDVAVFTAENGNPDKLQLLMIRRGNHPCRGMYALPGGFVNPDETMDQAAGRELMEETGVRPAFMTQMRTFSTPGRDPRGWTITGAYVSLVNKEEVNAVAGDDAAEAHWFDVNFSIQAAEEASVHKADADSPAEKADAVLPAEKADAESDITVQKTGADASAQTEKSPACGAGDIWTYTLTHGDTCLSAELVDERKPEDIGPRLRLMDSRGLAFDHGEIVAYAIYTVRRLLNAE